MTGTVVIMISQKNSLSMKLLKEVKKINKKITSLENVTMKKASTGPSLYYDR